MLIVSISIADVVPRNKTPRSRVRRGKFHYSGGTFILLELDVGLRMRPLFKCFFSQSGLIYVG